MKNTTKEKGLNVASLTKIIATVEKFSQEQDSDIAIEKLHAVNTLLSSKILTPEFIRQGGKVLDAINLIQQFDNMYLRETAQFSNLLKDYLVALLYDKAQNYNDYNKGKTLPAFNDRKLFTACINALLNAGYYIPDFKTQVTTNWIKGEFITNYNIFDIIVRPLTPSNTLRNELENKGFTFYDKPADKEQAHSELEERRQEAYTLLAGYGLDDLLN
jgi:hypothetical protein